MAERTLVTPELLRMVRELERRCGDHYYTPAETVTRTITTAIGMKWGRSETHAKPIYTDYTFSRCANCRRATRQTKYDALGLKKSPPSKPANYPSAQAYVRQKNPLRVSETVPATTDDQKLTIWSVNVAAWDRTPVEAAL